MKKIDQVSHTKVAAASVDIATVKAVRRFDGVKIFYPNVTTGELSTEAETAIARILIAERSGHDVSVDDKVRLWNALQSARRLRIVFDSYSSYKARTSHLRALEQIIAKADELINLLESQPVDLRPGVSIERRHPMFKNYISTLQDLRTTAGLTIGHGRKIMSLEPDLTFNDWFVRHLLQPVYAEIFKRPAKVTILADGRPGPFIRFVQQAYRELNLRPLTAEGTQTLFKRAQKKRSAKVE
jgi:hypothetical protein